MRVLYNIIDLLKQSRLYKELSGGGHIRAQGADAPQKYAFLAALIAEHPGPALIILPGRDEIRSLRREVGAVLPGLPLEELYPDEQPYIAARDKSLEITAARLILLRRLREGERLLALVTAQAAGQYLPAPEALLELGFKLVAGQEYDMGEVVAWLAGAGYERATMADAPGRFCVRGGIVDVFPLNLNEPLRLEWFGETLDSIRAFALDSQRSSARLPSSEIMPVESAPALEPGVSLFSYLPDGAAIFIDEPEKCALVFADCQEAGLSWEDMEKEISDRPGSLSFSLFTDGRLPFARAVFSGVRTIAPYHRQVEFLAEDLQKYLDKGVQPVVMMGTAVKAQGMAKNLTERGVLAQVWEQGAPRPPGRALFLAGDLSAGFSLPDEDWLLIGEKDIFGVLKRRRLGKPPAGDKIRYFSEIRSGDYVVHAVHGIGRYSGTETISAGGARRDYLLLAYAGDDKLYVPVEQVGTLQKYIGAEGAPPRLSRMGGADWSRVRGRAKAAVSEMAAELLRLQAERRLIKGRAFSPDTVWQKEFEEAFPYEETPDQLRAIAEIKADMEKPYPMDRILCGDVGYGKTEVAIRAAFKAVMGGTQVAVLVPTTVLAQQHFVTFCERMQPFGLNIGMVSRFRTPKEQRAALKEAAAGRVDVLIGTHRLLQSDVSFKTLGLLIVDEEQRFGVGQKEKIKRWTKDVDVLSLSATPIPRTLHMGLAGARDMSIIETAPEDRLPVDTYVTEYSDELVRQAVMHEIRRGGCVYYVYNKVRGIERIAEHLRALLPGVSVKVAHGQMPEELLEAVMMEFYQGGFDVLLCTTIIENGLDIASANTIIVHGAENFGLSQLYQMRGRVGRSSRLAHAWFFYPPQRAVSELAQKRLKAILDFADLGAGFRIAMRDLELRGAGNILGAQQHGHLLSVGFETYCRLIEETMRELSDEPPGDEAAAEPLIDLSVDAYIPGEYIDEPGHRLDVYRRLPYVNDEEDMRELLDELVDRFGLPPQPALNLLKLAMLRGVCRHMGIKAVNMKGLDARMVFDDQPRIKPEILMSTARKYLAAVKPGPPVTLKVRQNKRQNQLDWLEEVLLSLRG